LFRQLGQHAVQNTWTQFGRSTRRFDHRGQTNQSHNQNSCGRGGLSCGNPRKQPGHAQECNHPRSIPEHPQLRQRCAGRLWVSFGMRSPSRGESFPRKRESNPSTDQPVSSRAQRRCALCRGERRSPEGRTRTVARAALVRRRPFGPTIRVSLQRWAVLC